MAKWETYANGSIATSPSTSTCYLNYNLRSDKNYDPHTGGVPSFAEINFQKRKVKKSNE